MSILNKIFLITGGARGLGKGFALNVLKRGGKVILVDILEDVGTSTQKEFEEVFPGQSIFYKGDVTDEALMKSIWENGESKFYGKISVLVNNAGVWCSAEWTKTLNINLISLMQMTYIAIEKMSIKNGGDGGVIINIGSIAGLTYADILELVPYYVSKSAVVSFTKSLASSGLLENDGIKVSALCPSVSDTEMLKELSKNETNVNAMKALNIVPMTIEKVANDFIGQLEDLHNEKIKSGDVLFVGPVTKYVNVEGFDLIELYARKS